jgi:hypothetical protein
MSVELLDRGRCLWYMLKETKDEVDGSSEYQHDAGLSSTPL